MTTSYALILVIALSIMSFVASSNDGCVFTNFLPIILVYLGQIPIESTIINTKIIR